MVSDRQVKGLFKSMSKGKKLSQAAQRADMCENTARKYIEENALPSELSKPREHQTHKDRFTDVWQDVVDLLDVNPKLEAKTIFE